MTDSKNLHRLLNLAYFFLKFRPRTEKEIEQYLFKKAKKRHFSVNEIEKVIKKLKEENLINDKEFINWFVEQRKTNKPKSQYVLKRELIRLGIKEDLIDKYFLDHPINEEDLAYKALLSKWSSFKNLSSEKRFQKAINFLFRRGFNFEVSKKTVKKMINNENN